jgi:hypothetical protein
VRRKRASQEAAHLRFVFDEENLEIACFDHG